jgi:hypothetical protein
MNQHQPPRRWRKDNRLVWAIAGLASISVVIIATLGPLQNWTWTEIIWRWLELLIIPVVLAAGAFWFNTKARNSEQEIARREIENDRRIAEDRVQEEALQRYLDRMQELIFDRGLRRSEEDAEIRSLARARTLTVLRSLDGNRKGQVLRFLYEAELIGKLVTEVDRGTYPTDPIIHLNTADLGCANLSGANLSRVRLGGASLTEVNLSNANLSGAWLAHADLWSSNLNRANLIGADLRKAELPSVDLKDALLHGADFRGTTLIGLQNWTPQQLAQARSLVGAFMPDGTKMTDKGWEEFKQRYRE